MFTALASLRRHIGLFIVLIVLVLLRIPNFFEPYWYGDEAIYLTIGNALNQGEILYEQIVDHKTPLIYYLARVPDQVSFRWLLLGWMLVTTSLFYALALKIFQKTWLATVAAAVLMIFTTLPWLEGNIPNGELFVMGFVMVGAIAFTHSPLWSRFLNSNQPQLKNALQLKSIVSFSSLSWLFLAGIGFGLGILTKVPALLDLGAFLLVFWFMAVQAIFTQTHKNRFTAVGQLVGAGLIFFAGVTAPILASVAYFAAIGAGQAYLNFGLLYNLHYTQTWQQDFGSPCQPKSF
jgi:hypothetical protein